MRLAPKIALEAENVAQSCRQFAVQVGYLAAQPGRPALELDQHRGLAAKIGAVARHPVLQNGDAPRQMMLLDGVFGAQQIALGDDFLHGKGRQHPRPRLRQAQGPARESRQNQKPASPATRRPARKNIACSTNLSYPNLQSPHSIARRRVEAKPVREGGRGGLKPRRAGAISVRKGSRSRAA